MRCVSEHSFDISKFGYINLLPVQNKRSKDPGDSKQMVQWRRDFLNAGYYDEIADKISEISIKCIEEVQNAERARVIDAGCGEGYYLTTLGEKLADDEAPESVELCGLDISKWAVQAATKRDKTIQWLVASNIAIPVAEHSVDLIICAFGFPVYEAFAKILKPGGAILLVDTEEQHLIEMRQQLYPTIKPFKSLSNEKAEATGFELQSSERLTFQITLPQVDIERLLGMTPHMHKAPKEGIEKVKSQDELTLTVDVNFRLLKK